MSNDWKRKTCNDSHHKGKFEHSDFNVDEEEFTENEKKNLPPETRH